RTGIHLREEREHRGFVTLIDENRQAVGQCLNSNVSFERIYVLCRREAREQQEQKQQTEPLFHPTSSKIRRNLKLRGARGPCQTTWAVSNPAHGMVGAARVIPRGAEKRGSSG